MKAFVDNNFIVTQIVQFPLDKVENIKGKGENCQASEIRAVFVI